MVKQLSGLTLQLIRMMSVLYLEILIEAGTTGLSIRHYYAQDYLNGYMPDPLPDVTGDGDDANCTITENTTDANYVTLRVEFSPAKDGYTLIDCRAKKDW
jgi:hypothetical protein